LYLKEFVENRTLFAGQKVITQRVIAMAHISTEQALQVPQQLQKQSAHSDSSHADDSARRKEQAEKRVLLDDAVTLLRLGINNQSKKVNVETFKNELGQAQAYIKETLKNKLAEYNLNPKTQLSIEKDIYGKIEIKGAMRPSDHEKLTTDLNNNKHFKDAFQRLSKQQPTLDYVDNVVKISSAYGVSNNLFNELISEQSEHNGLNDIAHRYESLKTNKASSSSDEMPFIESDKGYRLTINA
jgi:hypothetical protein